MHWAGGHLSTAAHTSSKELGYGPLPERDYALNTTENSVLWLLERCRCVWFARGADFWTIVTSGSRRPMVAPAQQSLLATCIDTTKAGWHTR
eukprot:scaffold25665_cov135-Isochrysis_galbana.AAC.3